MNASHSTPIVKLETQNDDDRGFYQDDSFGDYGMPDAGTTDAGDFAPLLKFEDRDYDQGQDDNGGRVGADFEEADVDPKVE